MFSFTRFKINPKFIIPAPQHVYLCAIPQLNASCAVTDLPVSIRSIALEYPIMAGKRTVPPHRIGMPKRRFEKPIIAVSSMTLKSHIRASSNPIPTAYPLKAATSGFLDNSDLFAYQRIKERFNILNKCIVS